MKHTFMRYAMVALSIALATTVMQCNGGGGGISGIAPSVTATVPANDAVDVAVDTLVQATFDADMDAATITDTHFLLQSSGGVTGTITYDAATKTATLTPSSNLEQGETYTASLTAGIRDSDGDPLEFYEWSFTVIDVPDVIATVPVSNAVDVAVDTLVQATFDEDMDEATIDDTSFILETSGGAAVAATVSYDASTKTATLTPTVNLEQGKTYTASLTTDILASDGNALLLYQWNFTTIAPPGTWIQYGGRVSANDAESEDPVMMILEVDPAKVGKAVQPLLSIPAVGYRHASHMMLLNLWDDGWGLPVDDPTLDRTHPTYGTPGFCTDGSTVYMAYSRNGAALQIDDIDFNNRVFVEMWFFGSSWTKLNGGDEISTELNDLNAWEGTIACAGAGYDPMAGYVEGQDADDAYVVAMGTFSSVRSPALSRNNSSGSYFTRVRTLGLMADAANSDTYVALWEDHHNEQDRADLYVSVYDGTAFSDIGADLAADYDQNTLNVPSMVLFNNELHIAYAATEPGKDERQVHVQKWDGANWVDVGTNPVSAYAPADHFASSNPDLVVADGVLYLAWAESDQYDGPFIYVAYWDDGTAQWVIDGDKLNIELGHETDSPSLAYSPLDGYLYIAFEEYVDGYPEIFVKRKLL